LIVRIRQRSRLESQLHDDPPALAREGSVSLDPVAPPSSGAAAIAPPNAADTTSRPVILTVVRDG
jgi:hypothetical protein